MFTSWRLRRAGEKSTRFEHFGRAQRGAPIAFARGAGRISRRTKSQKCCCVNHSSYPPQPRRPSLLHSCPIAGDPAGLVSEGAAFVKEKAIISQSAKGLNSSTTPTKEAKIALHETALAGIRFFPCRLSTLAVAQS
jgi:hypothetical protein